MTLHLETGYTSVRLQRVGAGGHMPEVPDGEPHMVIKGDRETVCGRVVRARQAGPPSRNERPCPDCIERLQEVDSADWPI